MLVMAKVVSQQGIAYFYDYKTKTKTPIANVSLKVAYAKPTTSGADGKFTLEFDGLGIGQKITHSEQPYYKGMKVFNKKEVDNWFIVHAPLRLIMCDYEEFELAKRDWYERGKASVIKRRDAEIATLKKENEDYGRKLSELREKYDRILDDMQKNADVMARIDQSELDDQMQEVLDLYQKGLVDEAMQKLSDMHLEETFVKTLDRKHFFEQEANTAKEDSLQVLAKLRSSIDLYKQNGEYDKAKGCLKLLADKLNTTEDIFDYAYFCFEQNIHQEAIDYFQKVLGMYRSLAKESPEEYESDVAATLNNMAILYRNTQRFADSEKMHLESLEIYRHLAKTNPNAYEPNLVALLNNLATFYFDTQRLTECEQICKEALEATNRLAMNNSQDNNLYVALTKASLARLYSNSQRFEESEMLYKDALEIMRSIDVIPQSHEQYLAMILNNLALLYKETQRVSDAERMQNEALEVCRRLADANPQAYEHYVAMMLMNLGNIYYHTKCYSDAEEKFKEALDIFRRLANDDSLAYKPQVAMMLINLAEVYGDTQRFSESELLLLEAYEINLRLAKDNPLAYEPNLAMNLSILASLYKNSQRYPESEQKYKEALEIRCRLSDVNPLAYESEFAMALTDLADLYREIQRITEAEQMYQEALTIYRRLVKDNPQVYESKMADVLNGIAILCYDTQQFAKAEKMYDEALEIYHRLAKDNPQVYEADLVNIMNNLANVYKETQRLAECEQICREVVEIRRRLAKENPLVYEPSLALSLNNLAGLYRDTQRYAEADLVNSEAYEIRQRLANTNPQVHNPNLAITCCNWGLMKICINQLFEAVQLFEECRQILGEMDMRTTDLQYSYNTSLLYLGRIYTFSNNYSNAYKTYEELLPLLKGRLDKASEQERTEYLQSLGNQTYVCIMMKKYVKAEQYAREVLSLDSTQHWAISNLAAALLFQGKYAEAEKLYIQYKDDLKNDFLDDLKIYAEAGIIPKERGEDVEKIEKMLGQ